MIESTSSPIFDFFWKGDTCTAIKYTNFNQKVRISFRWAAKWLNSSELLELARLLNVESATSHYFVIQNNFFTFFDKFSNHWYTLHTVPKDLLLYHRSRNKVRVGSGLPKEFLVKVGEHQGSGLSPLLFAMVIDEVTEIAKKSWMKQILYADLMGKLWKNWERTLMNKERRLRAKRWELILGRQSWW